VDAKATKVLVIDDSDVILESLRSFLEKYNFSVIKSHDGLDGIQKSAEHKPALIFLDLMMPNVDGMKMLEVKKVIKEIRDIPVIVISANTARSNVLSAMERGADRVISKPLDFELVKKYVDELLGKKNFNETKKNQILSDNDSNEIKVQLIKFFIDSFNVRQKTITDSIKNKDAARLKTALHEIRGAGGTIGYSQLTVLSGEVEDRDLNSPTDWVFAEFKCNQIFEIVRQIKNNYSK